MCRAYLKEFCLEKKEGDSKAIFNDLWENYTMSDSSDDTLNFAAAGGNSFTALQFFNELKLSFNNIPDSFLGMLMQKRTRNDLWQMIASSDCKYNIYQYFPF